MNKCKVVEFIGRIQDGGAETLVKDYALLLDKDRFDVVVLCLDYVENSFIYKTLVNNNVRIVCLYEKSFFVNKVLARTVGQRHVSRLFIKAIKKINPDVIHIHSELLEAVSYSADQLKDIKLLYTCHNPPELLIGEKRPKEMKACRYLIDHNNLQLIALHDDMRKEINDRFDVDNTEVVRNGINFESFNSVKESKEEIRREFDIASDAYVIGQVGRYAYQKNPEFTIKVFNELLKKNDKAVLLLIGRGNKEKELRQLVSDLKIDDKVRFLVARNDVPRLFKMMDVFILPSRFEGFGIVLIEAQANKLPCVVSENIPESAYQSKAITRLNLDDPVESWVDALLHPTGNIDRYGDINDYDMHKVIKHLEDIYLS